MRTDIFLLIFSVCFLKVTGDKCLNKNFNVTDSSTSEWEAKTADELRAIIANCLMNVSDTDKVNLLIQMKAHIINDENLKYALCVHREAGTLTDNTFHAERLYKQTLSSQMTLSQADFEQCLKEAKLLCRIQDFLTYLSTCLSSSVNWKAPTLIKEVQNRQECQKGIGITQYEICHGTINPTIIGNYSLCDARKSEIYYDKSGKNQGFQLYRMSRQFFSYLPPNEAYECVVTCLTLGREYAPDELFTPMECINNCIPPKWSAKTKVQQLETLKMCQSMLDLSSDQYKNLQNGKISVDNLDLIRCFNKYIGFESGGCFLINHAVPQFIESGADSVETPKAFKSCYEDHFTSELWDELGFYGCIFNSAVLRNALPWV